MSARHTWIGVVVIRLAVLAVLPAAGCGRAPNAAAAAGTSAVDPSGGAANTLVVEQQMLKSIKLDTIQERDLPRTLSVAGKVQFDEDRLAHILAPLAGPIVGLHVKVGDVVRKGQVLCAISSREAAAAVGEHIESHKDLELSEKTVSMTQDLFDHEAASKIALQQAQNDLAKAKARVARSEEALHVLGLGDELGDFNGRVPIASPLGGTIIERHITDGQFVQADSTPIITVGDLSEVWVLGDVFERDLRLVSVGQTALVITAAYPGERFQGRVSHISDTIDPAARSAKVRVNVANPGGRLKPEMFASIVLDVAEHERVVTVPSHAVFTEDGRTFVYAEVTPGHFVRRAIDVGQDEGPDRRVLGGLRAGEKVVVDGALLLRQEEDKRGG